MGKRLVLYVPDNRQAQVDEWRNTLNYSRLFFEAFDRAVALQKDIDSMSDDKKSAVVERLKRESAEAEAYALDLGVRTGVIWAERYATKRHLRVIGGDNPEVLIGTDFQGLYSLLERCYDSFVDRDNEIVPDFALWDEEELEAWAEGFVKGATETWNAIADQL